MLEHFIFKMVSVSTGIFCDLFVLAKLNVELE